MAQITLNQAMENHLRAIHEALETNEWATTSDIAKRLGISSASVTAMSKKLSRLKLVTYVPYHGVQLTKLGEKSALEIVRHHRLLELYLSEALGVPWDRVHDEAEKLEHVLSEELEERISASSAIQRMTRKSVTVSPGPTDERVRYSTRLMVPSRAGIGAPCGSCWMSGCTRGE